MDSNVFKRRRLKVGLLVSHIEEDFDRSVCEGAMIAAEQTDVNLFIFPGRYIDGVYADKIRTEYEYQYNTLFDIPCENRFDVLLVLIGTIGSHLTTGLKAEFLKKFDGTPVITITANVDGYACMTVDNRTGLEAAIEHLIEAHGCKDIGFVSGPETSDDAIERLGVYKNVLLKHGFGYDENKVAYGNFSKYVTEEVGELIDRNPGLDAIVFANDQMASAGYKAMEQRGIRPGKDIYVTGFDDDPIAQELAPHLTTVKADPSELGYNALIEAVNYLNTGRLENSNIPSVLVIRNSCGCKNEAKLNNIINNGGVFSEKSVADQLSSALFSKYSESEETRGLKKIFSQIILDIEKLVSEKKCGDAGLRESIMKNISLMTEGRFFALIDLDSVYAIFEYAHKYYTEKLESHDERLELNKLFIRIYKRIAEENAAHCKQKLEDSYVLTWHTNSITRDMLVFQAYDDRAYYTVVDKLIRLNMKSSYLYVFDPAVINRKTDKWKLPESIMLKAYHNGDEAATLPPDQQGVRPDQLLSNKYLPQDRRYSMIVSPLFSNEEHYGLLLCEMESYEYFNYLQSITVQLCAALKIITLIKRQAITQRQLQQSLIEIKENNQILTELSKKDSLTDCFNRRGFYEEVRKKLKLEENEGANAVMVFADLDDLTFINNTFGHKEGDFAIQSAAGILRKAFDDKAIVGRIGGDEIVAFSFIDDSVEIASIRERINEVTEELNSKLPDKPYIIHTSTGVYPVKCTDTVEIGELLSHADALLYEQKKHKKPILKK